MEADRDWLTVAVTAPDHVDGEAWRILRLLTSGAADIVHVRKPGWDRQRLRDLLPVSYTHLRAHETSV